MKGDAFIETVIKPCRLMVQQSPIRLLSVIIGQSLEFEVMTYVHIYAHSVFIFTHKTHHQA